MLEWIGKDRFPLCLAPMAGVTDFVFRGLCKELGADMMVTEFVSAEGILQADERTRKYTEFSDLQRPVGVQLFGADGVKMGAAANKIIAWKQPDFIDINFGCPVNKVIARNGGSSLLKDCRMVEAVAANVVKAVAGQVPVAAKMRIGWDARTINAVEVAKVLVDCGVQLITVHGRTRSQGYGGVADWDVIDAVARTVPVPVIGNGDITSGADVARRKRETAVAGVMIGRAAMSNPWIFREAKEFLLSGGPPPAVLLEERWELVIEHCRRAVAGGRQGNERQTLTSMRSRLMAYCKGFPGARELRQKLCHVASVEEIGKLAAFSIGHAEIAGLL